MWKTKKHGGSKEPRRDCLITRFVGGNYCPRGCFVEDIRGRWAEFQVRATTYDTRLVWRCNTEFEEELR